MTETSPFIVLPRKLAIGYSQPLARFEDEVLLEGGTHFLLARNGRGKTTLLRTLAGSLKPLEGNFRTRGFMQYMPEDLRFDPEISSDMIFRALLDKKSGARALDLAKSIELDTRKPYGQLSTGNRRKANLIMAEFSTIANRGNILLLDEPFSGLDAFARQVFEELWQSTSGQVLRLVSCHPDYDSMSLSSALLIDGGSARHFCSEGQTWSDMKSLLH